MLKLKLLLILVVAGMTNELQGQILSSDWKVDDIGISNIEKSRLLDLNNAYSSWRTAQVSTSNFMESLNNYSGEIQIPNPGGSFDAFEITPTQVVAQEVAHFYTIQTFRGFKKDDPTTIIACDVSLGGFHAAVYSGDESYYIEPVDNRNVDQLLLFYGTDCLTEKTSCLFESKGDEKSESGHFKAPSTKLTYRLAMVSGGEYSLEFGGFSYSETNVLNALASGVNSINPLFLRDLGIEFNLVSTPALIFQNPATDPFTSTDPYALIVECHEQCDIGIGNFAYDVGHLVLWSNTGGLATHEAVCQNFYKGEGFSGSATSNKTLWIDYVSHELGHQFGSDHNFAADCFGNSVNGYRYEPGEGSSIMSYANVCGGTNQYRGGSDPFFHYSSIEQIHDFLGFTSCATTASGNSHDPIPDAKSDFIIPKETPFILVGDASDGNDASSSLTYNWEQYDGNAPISSGYPDCSASDVPLFRYRVPVSENYRCFPIYHEVLDGNNNGVTWEKLPCAPRIMNFSMAVRDNNASFGRVAHDEVQLTVANTGPFEVTAPNGGESYAGSTTVTWAVNGTDAHCPLVDILLSTNGGNNYTVVADGVANDGSHSISFGNPSTSARVLVRCDVPGGFRTTSTFYDTSDDDFTITSATAGFQLQCNLFLEGAYDGGGQMTTDLRAEIPLAQPYNAAPYNYFGSETLVTVPLDMVDWVLLEMRTGTPQTLGARNTVTVERRVGILLKDGSVVNVNGDPVVFQNLNFASAYRLCVRHRNHLDVLSSAPAAAAAFMNYDFTAIELQAFGEEQLKIDPDGTALMYAGDFNHDSVIQNTDFDIWQADPALIDVYKSSDANLDGIIQTTDFDLWNFNKAKIGHPELEF